MGELAADWRKRLASSPIVHVGRKYFFAWDAARTGIKYGNICPACSNGMGEPMRLLKGWLLFSVMTLAGTTSIFAACPDQSNAGFGIATKSSDGTESNVTFEGRTSTFTQVNPPIDRSIAFRRGKTHLGFFPILIEDKPKDGLPLFANYKYADGAIQSILSFKAGDRIKYDYEFSRGTSVSIASPIKYSVELSVTGTETFSVGSCSYSVLKFEYSFQQLNGNSSGHSTFLFSPDLHLILKADGVNQTNGNETKINRYIVDVQPSKRGLALAECKNGPKLSGGPWFSSTYSIAAQDTIRSLLRSDEGEQMPLFGQMAPQRGFLCVASVEYISAAVNQFGGNAARARFVGFDNIKYEPLSEVRDFPY